MRPRTAAAWSVTALALAVAGPGCGGSSSPTSPTSTSIPPANIITASAQARFDDACTPDSAYCTFYMDATNTGEGCADNVTGTVTFSASTGPVQNGAITWSLDAERVIRPGETFTYSGTVTGTVLNASGVFTPAGATISTSYQWRDVPC